MLRRLFFAVPGEGVEEDVELPLRDHARVELPDRAGRGVPRVGEKRLPCLFAVAVDRLERGEGQVDLAPDFDFPALADPERQGPDRLDVGRHVVALEAVPPGDGPDDGPVAVNDRDAQAVDLELAHVGDLPAGEELADPVVELFEFPGRVDVVDAHHRRRMADGGEAVEGFPPDALGRGIGRDQARIGRFEGLELLDQGVELGVGDLRIALDVVFLLVMEDLGPEAPDAGRGLLQGRDLLRHGGVGSPFPGSLYRESG